MIKSILTIMILSMSFLILSCMQPISTYEIEATVLAINGKVIKLTELNDDKDYLYNKNEQKNEFPDLMGDNKISIILPIFLNDMLIDLTLTNSQYVYFMNTNDNSKIKLTVILDKNRCSPLRTVALIIQYHKLEPIFDQCILLNNIEYELFLNGEI